MTDLLCPKCDGITVEHTLNYVKELTAQRDKLLAVLAAFGKHGPGCSGQIGECDCGFVAAIANAVRSDQRS